MNQATYKSRLPDWSTSKLTKYRDLTWIPNEELILRSWKLAYLRSTPHTTNKPHLLRILAASLDRMVAKLLSPSSTKAAPLFRLGKYSMKLIAVAKPGSGDGGRGEIHRAEGTSSPRCIWWPAKAKANSVWDGMDGA
ncbi:hypothetical protein PspLS_04930 [Pyricularia sp. CBS 133598]|nr:hypothetical protein PspLS_04930 [Pyricularia sp. CBS 133598]